MYAHCIYSINMVQEYTLRSVLAKMWMCLISNFGIRLIKLLNEPKQNKSPPRLRVSGGPQEWRSSITPARYSWWRPYKLSASSVCLISGEDNLIPPALPSLYAWASVLTVPWAAECVITLFGLAARTETVRDFKSGLPDCEGKDRHHGGTIWKIPCLGWWSCLFWYNRRITHDNDFCAAAFQWCCVMFLMFTAEFSEWGHVFKWGSQTVFVYEVFRPNSQSHTLVVLHV